MHRCHLAGGLEILSDGVGSWQARGTMHVILVSDSLVGSCAMIVTVQHKVGWRVQLALTVCHHQQ